MGSFKVFLASLRVVEINQMHENISNLKKPQICNFLDLQSLFGRPSWYAGLQNALAAPLATRNQGGKNSIFVNHIIIFLLVFYTDQRKREWVEEP